MRFSAISSRVKSCVSSSTLAGSFGGSVTGRLVAGSKPGVVVGVEEEPQRKMLLKDCQSVAEELGTEAILRDSARSRSTAALTRYVIAVD